MFYSPTKPTGGGKMEMFSNVKNQIGGIGGWLGSNIPKLKKVENENTPENPQDATGIEEVAPPAPEHPPKDEDDNSRYICYSIRIS